jgi:DNA-binding winged helix-turn-helix (wHTH) protein
VQERSKEIHTNVPGGYRFGGFELYPSERQLYRGSNAVAMPPKVFDALLLFVRNAGRLVRRDSLIESLWPGTFVTDANLTNMIVSIRKVLGRDAIQTVSKFGYRFTIPVVGEPGIDETTYATFLRAKELAEFKSVESMQQARDLFSVCVAADPEFAAGWAWLGRSARFLDKFKHDTPTNLDLAQAAFQRALAIDPDLACAHQFYTQLQVDLGQSRDAVVRLGHRIVQRGDEPESYAGLVHAMRYSGLLEESVAAHTRATALDPALVTSVAHTHFLRGDYRLTLDSTRTRYYLDAAAWTALGARERALTLLKTRLAPGDLSSLMTGLMGSLRAILEDRRDEAAAMMRDADVHREPEMLFYFARHFAMLGDQTETVRMVQRARREGFTVSYALAHDGVFGEVRSRHEFQREIDESARIENETRRALEGTGLNLLNALNLINPLRQA